MWTIEAIRVKYPFKNIVLQFVSSQPLLLDKKFIEDERKNLLNYRLDVQQLHQVYKAFKKWWESYNHENFEEIRKVNPMENFDYVRY